MKFEIEIPEADVFESMEKHIKEYTNKFICDYTNTYMAQKYIKDKLKEMWTQKVDALIGECLNDTPVIEEQIKTEMMKKLSYKINVLMKQTKPED